MEYEAILKTNDKGELHIYNKPYFDAFFKKYPNKDFKIIIQGVKQSTGRLDAYYEAEVLPKCIEGFRKLGMNFNKAMCMDKVREFSPVMKETKIINGKTKHNYLEWDELNEFQKHRHIEEIIIFAAENLYTQIENPFNN